MEKSLPRRIVAVTGAIDPGEGELVTLRMLTALRSRGWQVTLTSPAEGALRDAAVLEGFRWVPLALGGRAPGQGVRAVSSWPLIRWLARRAGIVHLGDPSAARLLPALIGGRGRRVLHVHEPMEWVPRFWRLADVVLTPSRAVADTLAPLAAHPVGVPVDLEPPRVPAPWAAEGGPGGGPVVAFVGAIEPASGALQLVRAAPAIRAGAPAARVLIVGDDPLAIDPSYTLAVTGAPHIEHHPGAGDAPGLLRQIDVLVLPAPERAQLLTAAEALAVGTPVVATRLPGIDELVEDGVSGRLVAPNDPAALAKAVLEVLAAREPMGAAARERSRALAADPWVDSVLELVGAGS